MKTTQFRHTASVLRNHPHLQGLLRQARQIQQLQQIVQNYLPEAALAHCHISAYQHGRLTLTTNSGHWATRLRYQQNRLLKQLEQHHEFADIQSIHLKICPTQSSMPNHKDRPEHTGISAQAGEILHQCAQTIEDPQLRAALERLAQHARHD